MTLESRDSISEEIRRSMETGLMYQEKQTRRMYQVLELEEEQKMLLE